MMRWCSFYYTIFECLFSKWQKNRCIVFQVLFLFSKETIKDVKNSGYHCFENLFVTKISAVWSSRMCDLRGLDLWHLLLLKQLSLVLICSHISFSAIVVCTPPGWEIVIQGLQKLDSAHGQPNLIWQVLEDFSSSYFQCAHVCFVQPWYKLIACESGLSLRPRSQADWTAVRTILPSWFDQLVEWCFWYEELQFS